MQIEIIRNLFLILTEGFAIAVARMYSSHQITILQISITDNGDHYENTLAQGYRILNEEISLAFEA